MAFNFILIGGVAGATGGAPSIVSTSEMTTGVSPLTYAPDPAFRTLYTAYTGDPDSIGVHLNDHMGSLSSGDPLLVATGSDVVIFPGDGRRPLVESFRNSTRGFVERRSRIWVSRFPI
jgi:hypothetical protein